MEDDFARALLGSAESDAPSHAAYAKAAAALGIGVGLGVGASLPAAAPAAVAVGAAGAAGAARWTSSLGAKLLLFGVSGALLVAAGALALRSSEPVQAPTSGDRAKASHAARTASEPLQAVPPLPPAARGLSVAAQATDKLTPSVEPTVAFADSTGAKAQPPPLRALPLPVAHALASAPSAAAPVARRVARPEAARVSSDSSLSEQVQSLDRARVALASGDSSSALAEIARYRTAWPSGVFLTEASVLEIEALAARGERSLAATRAADFVADHPDSPQANRLRALIPAKKR